MNAVETVKVWDIAIRIFHWSLVSFFVIAFATHEDVGELHIVSGYIVLALVLFRILWGFVGTKYARFSDFVYSPSTVLRYLINLFTGKVDHYLGHNPAGGWMVLALLFSLLVVSYTGLKAYGAEGQGPLAGQVEFRLIQTAQAHNKEAHEDEAEDGESGEGEGYWHELHEAASDITLALIFLHLIGVAVASRLHKEKLVLAMITGRKNKL